jgi:hypothetical protein
MCMQCVAQASPMIAGTFGVLRRDELEVRVRAAVACSGIPVVSEWAAKPLPRRATRQQRILERAQRRVRPDACYPFPAGWSTSA